MGRTVLRAFLHAQLHLQARVKDLHELHRIFQIAHIIFLLFTVQLHGLHGEFQIAMSFSLFTV